MLTLADFKTRTWQDAPSGLAKRISAERTTAAWRR
jgi:hypothetical protein